MSPILRYLFETKNILRGYHLLSKNVVAFISCLFHFINDEIRNYKGNCLSRKPASCSETPCYFSRVPLLLSYDKLSGTQMWSPSTSLLTENAMSLVLLLVASLSCGALRRRTSELMPLTCTSTSFCAFNMMIYEYYINSFFSFTQIEGHYGHRPCHPCHRHSPKHLQVLRLTRKWAK